MHTATTDPKHKSAGAALGAGAAPAANGTGDGTGEKSKSKRGGARRAPEGQTLVKFFVPTDEYTDLAKIADEDDRKPEDLCRVLARKKVRDYRNGTGNT